MFRALKHVEIGDAKFLQRHASRVDQVKEEEKAALDDDPPAGAAQKKILPARREGQEDASADIQDIQPGIDPQEPPELARLALDARGIVIGCPLLASRPLPGGIAQAKGRNRRVDSSPKDGLHAKPAPKRRAHQQQRAADQDADRAPEQKPARQNGLKIPKRTHSHLSNSAAQVFSTSERLGNRPVQLIQHVQERLARRDVAHRRGVMGIANHATAIHDRQFGHSPQLQQAHFLAVQVGDLVIRIGQTWKRQPFSLPESLHGLSIFRADDQNLGICGR